MKYYKMCIECLNVNISSAKEPKTLNFKNTIRKVT